MRERPTARFEACPAPGRSLVFHDPVDLLVAHRAEEIHPLLTRLEEATRNGRWAAGYLAYEAAGAFGLPVQARSDEDGAPLAWFAIFEEAHEEPALELREGPLPYESRRWSLGIERAEYEWCVEAIRREIARGATYQANLTVRAEGEVHGDLFEFWRDLALAQRGEYAAYLDLGSHVVASASPELFFSLVGETLTSRPMKGTARRGRTREEDLAAAAALLASPKERAENVMIVDLMRNDLGRLARFGSVGVPELFSIERYETIWQLTSTVTAAIDADAGIATILAALFPAGSITGAPKRRSMEILAALEDRPRGVYCGAIGVLAPAGAPFRARFSVAIRTAVVERASGHAHYGAGGGITWGSVPAREFEEVLAKTAILHERPARFALIETLGYDPRQGFRNGERHLARLADSAAYFGFRLDSEAVRAALEAALDGVSEARRVRIVLARDGGVEVTTAPLGTSRSLVSLAIDLEPVDAEEIWRFHKTTRREAYEVRAARHPEADDVILVNERGELTETTVANLMVFVDGYWYTPPLGSGCLPGVGRAIALAEGRCFERVLTLDDLERADALAVVSSLRGWRAAALALEPALIA